jgi:SAM-dependent methyltransferase
MSNDTPKPPAPTLDQIKANMRTTWMEGDFGVIARTTAASGESFVASLALAPGDRVLDVACGTGNLAIPAARQGCIVTGVDIAPNLLTQARERAAAENLNATFDEGDAEALPYADATFDAVITMFGAMFAPRPEIVAAEFARVLKPGGLLAMANWNPQGFTGAMFRLGSKHVPPPPGLLPPLLWGDDTTVRQRLAPHFTEIHTELVPIDFDLPTNPAGAVAFFRQYFGPTKVAFSKLDPAGQTAFATELEALWASANTSPNPTTHTLVPNQFLKVTATRT